MSTTPKKKPPIALSTSRDIPLDKLVLSQANVRKNKAGVSIEELAEDIARRGLLQGLSVRPVMDETGAETGMYEVPAGGRRFRALERLVKQRRLAKDALIPCLVREGGIAEEDSLAENVHREALHPLDQFRAFLTLREKGQSAEEIAAAFFVSLNVVKQRLKLAAVSPVLLNAYAEDAVSLDQLMAFTVTGDHGRQEEVFERVKSSYDKTPYSIRRMLTEGAVRASDKRALFVGVGAYIEAGGTVLRDLFESDDGGWLQDASLLDRLVVEKLQQCAEPIATEGWKWVQVATDFPYGHTYGLRRIHGETVPLTAQEEAARAALQVEYDRLVEEYQDSGDDLPDLVDERFAELETTLAAFEDRPTQYDPEEIARAGAFISITGDGRLCIESGYVRPEDERVADREGDTGGEIGQGNEAASAAAAPGTIESTDAEDDNSLAPISDKLLTELTAHRTLGLRYALGACPDVALLATLHALVLKAFYHHAPETCLDLLRSNNFGGAGSGLQDSAAAEVIRARHDGWSKTLPEDAGDLWDALGEWDADSRSELFAHVVSLSVNAVHETWNRRSGVFAHADCLSQAVELDMTKLWAPTAANYLGRVTKGRILQAVAEAKGQRAADRIAHLKKGDMAIEAETLLAGSDWLPDVLRPAGDSGAADPVLQSAGDSAGQLEAADDSDLDEPVENDGRTVHPVAAE
ncbi:ParB N-terminal domain-containing protein [Devosia sp. XJ19-1]|uniref:ParB N-terminal domain-containing protein n=1 Tax=Devosia ureilytica TaxID=2952754 RepID=A0A9Q4AMD5_9HYPH|nr:ParB N-terminal domain-containing protein [Devosia ureilytica]MCP8883369.1 ParB N-terminal domain-containing protein [Devosia ureilytica]MCP8886263.1 ParB N-terminal domain-containing protein [Devosia ureilytica]